ncbi:hypothetical protein PRIPAC_82904 [Pristionchus pacificus]|uniref:Uncharacterized protein n=1 Tax=Pristionchus pacificus TaxID=54126 RepID=A0A2A6BY97_PRIPA|nr:hypothetical protein PRIPAC_82904 [Pristionchus pacificus]|eukprot:PDM70982.1 hypothetical protein PRIPAC_44378 [Pristionchus pacificus]
MHEGEEVKVLEFYCGIGGIHFALKSHKVYLYQFMNLLTGTSIPFHIAAAFDINTTTNVIYRHNFPSTKLKESNIQGLSVSSLDKLGAELWTMSPPCQPFTLKGNRMLESLMEGSVHNEYVSHQSD